MSEPIRWGISSTGHIAAKFVQGLALLDDAVVAAVGSRTADAAERFGQAHDIARRHGSLAELAADDELDVIYVASTANAHCEDTIRYLEAGIPVLCEKPFAVNASEAQRMVDAAAASGVLLMEALWSRFQPAYVLLRDLLTNGAIGTPKHIEAEFAFRVPPAERRGSRLFDAARLGGAVVDLGIYPIHLCHFVFGAPTTVEAAAVLEGGVDLQTSISLGWPTATATLFCSVDVDGRNQARIAGDEGVITLDARMHAPPRLTLERVGAAPEHHDVAMVAPGLQYQAEEVQRCLRAGLIESPVMPWSETLAMMRTLAGVRDRIGLRFPSE